MKNIRIIDKNPRVHFKANTFQENSLETAPEKELDTGPVKDDDTPPKGVMADEDPPNGVIEWLKFTPTFPDEDEGTWFCCS